MGEPSSPPSAAEHLESDDAPLLDLNQHYRIEPAMRAAHQREVERRRAAVRAVAEQEASEILLAAQREICRVLVRTRQELVTLTAQVRAADCEAAADQFDQSIVDDDFQLSGARQVRLMLRGARSELLDLARDSVNRWPAGEEALLSPSTVAMVPASEPAAANDFWSPFSDLENGGAAADSREQVPALGPAEKLIAHWRTAAVGVVILAIVAIAIVVLRPSSSTETAVTPSRPGAAGSTASPPVEGTTFAAPVTAPNPSMAAAADQAGARPPTQASLVRPPEQAAARRARTEPAAPPAAVEHGSPAQTHTAELRQPTATAGDSPNTAEREILDRHQQWFDAFERGDRAAMTSLASENFSLVDQRPERAAEGPGRVEHAIREVRVQVTGGVGAVLSGRIVETRADDAATVAMLSEVWIRTGEEWRLVSVRMVPLSAVPTTLQ